MTTTRGRAVVAAALVMLAAGVGGAALIGGVPEAAQPADPDPATMEAKAAYEQALALSRAGHHNRSLPYFRRALMARPDLWQVQFDYATGLANASVEVAPHRHIPGPVSRSSWERVAMMREAWMHLAIADSVAPDAASKGLTFHRLASLLATWELEWDTLRGFQLALLADSVNPMFREAKAKHLGQMHRVRSVGAR